MVDGPFTCDNCGMLYWDWLGQPGEEKLIPNPHTCPEPFDRETAESLLQYFSSTGIPTSQRIKAKIKLGLREE